jgi:hypothetical protein
MKGARVLFGPELIFEDLPEPMNTEASGAPAPKSGNPFIIFAISFCAAIVMAGGFAIVVEAFIIAAANLFELGGNFVWVASGANALTAAWFALWTFVRSWHVERRLRSGLEVDEPKMSILATLRG